MQGGVGRAAAGLNKTFQLKRDLQSHLYVQRSAPSLGRLEKVDINDVGMAVV